MPVLPVPLIISLILWCLLAQRLFARDWHPTLIALMAACAVQSGLIALIHYYGIAPLRPAQPLLATLIPPLAWLALRHAAGQAFKPRRALLHGAGLAVGFVCLLWQPELLDVLIPLSFTAYGLAMLWHLSHGEESLPHSPLENGASPLLAWRIIALSLIASAACDIYIAVQLARGSSQGLLWVPSLISTFSLFSLGALSLSRAMDSTHDEETASPPTTAEDAARDKQIIEQLDAYMRTHKPFLDPDLTLARLSRKMLTPAKSLSTAINRVKGENLSRYINAQRIEEACRKMMSGNSITAAMFDAGFNTKSNFNREFLRIKKMSPREWQMHQAGSLQKRASAPNSVRQ